MSFPFHSRSNRLRPARSYSPLILSPMPNHLQLLFLASFFITFVLLLTISNILSSKLREAGYDISKLILIGLPQSPDAHPHIPNQMSTSAPSFLDVRQSVLAQLVALLLAVATSAFVYLKFGRSGTSSFFRLEPLQPLTLRFSQETRSRSKGMAKISSQRKNHHIPQHCPVRPLPLFAFIMLTSNIDTASLFHTQVMFLVSPLANI